MLLSLSSTCGDLQGKGEVGDYSPRAHHRVGGLAQLAHLVERLTGDGTTALVAVCGPHGAGEAAEPADELLRDYLRMTESQFGKSRCRMKGSTRLEVATAPCGPHRSWFSVPSLNPAIHESA